MVGFIRLYHLYSHGTKPLCYTPHCQTCGGKYVIILMVPLPSTPYINPSPPTFDNDTYVEVTLLFYLGPFYFMRWANLGTFYQHSWVLLLSYGVISYHMERPLH